MYLIIYSTVSDLAKLQQTCTVNTKGNNDYTWLYKKCMNENKESSWSKDNLYEHIN